MNQRKKKKMYEYGARATVWVHLFIVVIYFACIALFFVKGVWRLIGALFIAVVWIQYKILGNCFVTKIENYYLRKAGKTTHRHFMSRLINSWVRGGNKKSPKFKQSIDAWSWHLKTIWFIIAMIIIIHYLITHLF